MYIEHVIQLLEYYGCIDDEIKLQAQEIRDAEEIYCSLSGVNMDGMPRGKNGFHSPTEATAIRAAQADTERIDELREQLEQMKLFKFKVQNELKALPISERTIINQKYKEAKGWREIAKRVCCSERTCRRRHKEAIHILAIKFDGNAFIYNYSIPQINVHH